MVQSSAPRVVNEYKVIMLLHGIHVKFDFEACVICHIATLKKIEAKNNTPDTSPLCC